ncbi:MAG: iron ABC transporter permease [Alphaproteobacteria bacterium]|nr:iron ABC transporter permease [Alphaproteobacteria bacterium]
MTTREFRSIWFLLSAAALALLLVFLVWPLFNLFSASLTAAPGSGQNGWVKFSAEQKYRDALANTLLLGAIVTVAATTIGVGLAYFTARYDFPLKPLIAVLPLTTLIVPEVIAAQTWVMMLGNNGVITRSLAGIGIELPSFYGWPGLIVVMTFIYYTYAYIGTLAAIRGFDVQLEEAAQSLGTSPARSRLLVMVPVVLPAIVASALLVFTLVVGNFAVATLLGHKVQLLSVLTYLSFVSEVGADPIMQSTLASVSILIVAAALFAQRWIVGRKRHEIVQGRNARPERLAGLRSLALAGVALITVVISLLPLATLVVGAFTLTRGPVMYWGQFSLANVERMLINAPDPLLNSLIYAGTATAVGIAFSVIVSYLVVKKRNLLTPVIDYIVMLPLAISGTVLGIGLVVTFNTGWFAMTGTATIIVVAYLIRRLPFGVRNASSTLYNIPNSIEEASISLGVSPIESFFRVALPLMVPAIAAAAVLTWTTTVAELSSSVVVYSAGRETAPIQIFRLIDTGLIGRASAYGLALVTMILLPILIAVRFFKLDLFPAR